MKIPKVVLELMLLTIWSFLIWAGFHYGKDLAVWASDRMDRVANVKIPDEAPTFDSPMEWTNVATPIAEILSLSNAFKCTNPVLTSSEYAIKWTNPVVTIEPVLEVKRPWIVLGGNTVVVFVTEAEFDILELAYSNRVYNKDRKQSMMFYSDPQYDQ